MSSHLKGRDNPSHRHGGYGTKLYHSWSRMLQRCEYKHDAEKYKHYGGRGIKVCSEWHDFSVFSKWAEENGYCEGLTIDRINVDGDYEPSNCRWVTRGEQARNRRSTIWVNCDGKTMTLKEASNFVGIPYKVVHKRIAYYGWSVDEALGIPSLGVGSNKASYQKLREEFRANHQQMESR